MEHGEGRGARDRKQAAETRTFSITAKVAASRSREFVTAPSFRIQDLLARGDVRADALGSVLQVHVGRFWGPVKWDTFLVSDFKWETGFGLLSPS